MCSFKMERQYHKHGILFSSLKMNKSARYLFKKHQTIRDRGSSLTGLSGNNNNISEKKKRKIENENRPDLIIYMDV